jgi:hypothetical protein
MKVSVKEALLSKVACHSIMLKVGSFDNNKVAPFILSL